MHTDKDQNSLAELQHDHYLSTLEEFDSEADEQKRFDMLWNGDGFQYYNSHVTMDWVYESVVNDYPEEDIDEGVLKYAVDYPESKWYKVLEDKAWDIVRRHTEGG